MGDDPRRMDADRLAELALRAMRARGIPPTPQNFAVWYLHQSGGNRDLDRDIAAIEERAQGFTAERSQLLYERYCGVAEQSQQLQLFSERVSGLVEDVSTKLGIARSETRDYSACLSSLGDDLAMVIEPGDLMALVRELESRTEQMRRRAGQLELELKRNTRELDELKDDLALARRAATTDSLTGLGNRKFFDDVFAAELRIAEATGAPLSLLVVDIDHFKLFNDRHGHQIGDVVLRLVADKLRHSVTERATVSRYGGEEFVLLLPDTPSAGASALGHQLCSDIARSRLVVRNRGQDLGRLTISVGIATFQPGDTAETCFRRADLALYQAKRDGRNRLVVAEPDAPAETALA